MYQQLAHLYDWPGTLDFSEKMLAKALALLSEKRLAPPARLIDLACGTGTLALNLAQKGYDVLGIDMAAPMLAQAQAKQAEANNSALQLQWRQDDMRYFLTDEPADAVLCHYDSLNHLSNESELRGTFIQVSQALKPGGWFFFDLNTLENYRTFWNGKDTYEGPNYRLKSEARFDEQLDKAEVSFMVEEYNEEGELGFESETVHEHYFNETAVEKYLMAADFIDIAYTPFNPVDELPEDFALKTLWQCRKR